MIHIDRIEIAGYRSIRDMTGERGLELRDLNVLIGANGSGKSNLISCFRMLRELGTASLEHFVGRMGGANSLMHGGAKATRLLRLMFSTPNGKERACYSAQLALRGGDQFFFIDEWVGTVWPGYPRTALGGILGSGHFETKLPRAGSGEPGADIRSALLATYSYHFADTSSSSPFQTACWIEDNLYLRSDGENLAPYLLMLREAKPEYYQRIRSLIRRVLPGFDDFVLEPHPGGKNIILRWKADGAEQVFGPHQTSDGSLRAFALITLLFQPPELLPKLVLLDEPELGLHPSALGLVAELIRTAAIDTQIIVATQSPALVDLFQPEEVIVAEREGAESVFRRLDRTNFDAWLEEYESLGTLWEMNVIGGNP